MALPIHHADSTESSTPSGLISGEGSSALTRAKIRSDERSRRNEARLREADRMVAPLYREQMAQILSEDDDE